MAFTRWSSVRPEAEQVLRPDLGIRSWDDISIKEKEVMWKYFTKSGWFDEDRYTYDAVEAFSNSHKAQAFCKYTLNHGGPHTYQGVTRSCCYGPAQMDMKHIFMTEHQDVVYEVISYYGETLQRIPNDGKYARFQGMFNDMSSQFGLNVLLAETGFTLRQDEKIVEEMYKPVLAALADPKWKEVNRELQDAFDDFLKNTPADYSSCITHAISGLQAYLQIMVHGKTGKGDIADLLKEAQKKGLIPKDRLTSTALQEIVSVLMIERQSKGDPHPKQSYGDEKSAKLVLNLIMVFIQHSL